MSALKVSRACSILYLCNLDNHSILWHRIHTCCHCQILQHKCHIYSLKIHSCMCIHPLPHTPKWLNRQDYTYILKTMVHLLRTDSTKKVLEQTFATWVTKVGGFTCSTFVSINIIFTCTFSIYITLAAG